MGGRDVRRNSRSIGAFTSSIPDKRGVLESMTAPHTPRLAVILPFPRPGTRYGVFTAEGKLLGTWNTHEQAERFIYPASGRFVAEVVDDGDRR